MGNTKKYKLEAFGKLLDVLDELRVKCPWDKKQTNESLRCNTIEEVYELSSALMNSDTEDIKKELGDVLLHIIFYAKIADEKGDFDIADMTLDEMYIISLEQIDFAAVSENVFLFISQRVIQLP